MKTRLAVYFGIFAVMGLSNAIVPVLPTFAYGSALQGAIYSAYFLGAFATTLPAGILSDLYGRVPFIRLGLAITVTSGLLLTFFTSPVVVLAIRCLEGAGAGLFVAAAMSYVNSLPGHTRLSGYFMAMLNSGLVIGLVWAGTLAVHLAYPAAGILFFSGLAVIPALASFFVSEPPPPVSLEGKQAGITTLISKYRWLWYSSVILVGITGVATSLYPEFTGESPEVLGFWIAGMSIATVAAVLIVSGISLPPIPAIRWSAALMAIGMIIAYLSPFGFVILGVLAGVVIIAQLAFLAEEKEHQGAAMGLFSTTSYLGMTLMPLITGIIAETTTFFIAFLITTLFAVSVALTIGRCGCRRPGVS